MYDLESSQIKKDLMNTFLHIYSCLYPWMLQSVMLDNLFIRLKIPATHYFVESSA